MMNPVARVCWWTPSWNDTSVKVNVCVCTSERCISVVLSPNRPGQILSLLRKEHVD